MVIIKAPILNPKPYRWLIDPLKAPILNPVNPIDPLKEPHPFQGPSPKPYKPYRSLKAPLRIPLKEPLAPTVTTPDPASSRRKRDAQNERDGQ